MVGKRPIWVKKDQYFIKKSLFKGAVPAADAFFATSCSLFKKMR
jgi:hypothetical protein